MRRRQGGGGAAVLAFAACALLVSAAVSAVIITDTNVAATASTTAADSDDAHVRVDLQVQVIIDSHVVSLAALDRAWGAVRLRRVDPLRATAIHTVDQHGTHTVMDLSRFLYFEPAAPDSAPRCHLQIDPATQSVRGFVGEWSLAPHPNGSATPSHVATKLSATHPRRRQPLRPGCAHGPTFDDSSSNKSHSTSHVTRRATAYRAGFNRCRMHLVADHLFFANVAGGDAALAVNLMLEAVLFANFILANTVFPVLGPGNRVQLAVAAVTVYTAPTDPYTGVPGLPETANVLLDRFSTGDWSSVCLAHLFTYVEFPLGVVGLAWIAAAGNSGGMCAPAVVDASAGASGVSRNTGLTSFLSYGQRQPAALTSSVFAHEVGHNFGAAHDPPGLETFGRGEFLMHAQAVDGTAPNNGLFSPAQSVSAMNAAIAAFGGCFVPPNATVSSATCGNGIPETPEACDCGQPLECALASGTFDACCAPAGTCQLAPGAKCSPRVFAGADGLASADGECCTAVCQPTPNGSLCGVPTAGRVAGHCDGAGTCLLGAVLPNRSLCDAFAPRGCVRGACAGLADGRGACAASVCALWPKYAPTELPGAANGCLVWCTRNGNLSRFTTAELGPPPVSPSNPGLWPASGVPMRRATGSICLLSGSSTSAVDSVLGVCTAAGVCVAVATQGGGGDDGSGSGSESGQSDSGIGWLNQEYLGLWRWLWLLLAGLLLCGGIALGVWCHGRRGRHQRRQQRQQQQQQQQQRRRQKRQQLQDKDTAAEAEAAAATKQPSTEWPVPMTLLHMSPSAPPWPSNADLQLAQSSAPAESAVATSRPRKPPAKNPSAGRRLPSVPPITTPAAITTVMVAPQMPLPGSSESESPPASPLLFDEMPGVFDAESWI